ncbi:MAG: hypothetical protein GY925_07135, partial [Actinomycetia bacterium]|nr:hypothetical protein [Actinomycetes bacterium]
MDSWTPLGESDPADIKGFWQRGPDQRNLAYPAPGIWTRLGLLPGAEVHAGYQSRVFRATGEAGPLVVKLIEIRG